MPTRDALLSSPSLWRVCAPALFGALLAGAATGQIAFDVPVPPSFPAVVSGPAFATGEALAVSGGGWIHWWTGLPRAPVHGAMKPDGIFTLRGPWHRLSASRAVYRALGADGTAGTADDPLMLVTGLPKAPVLVDTGLRGVPAGFTPVDAQTAVRASGSELIVLHHDVTGAFLRSVAVPYPCAGSPLCQGGPTPGATYTTLGTGPDLVAGTADDVLLVLAGLGAAVPVVNVVPLPPGTVPDGLWVSGSGVAVLWQEVALPQVLLTLVRDPGGSPAFETVPVTPPASPSPAFTPDFGVRPAPGDAALVFCEDDLGPGEGRALVSGLAGQPSVQGTWYDDLNGGCSSTVLSETEVARYCAAGSNGFTYTDFASGAGWSWTQAWSEVPVFLKASPTSLAAASTEPAAPGGGVDQALLTVFPDARDVSTGLTLVAPGRWAGDGFGASGAYWPRRLEVLSPGLVAGFISPPGGSAADRLRIVNVPSVGVHGTGTTMGPSAVQLAVTSGVPGAANLQARFEITTPGGWDPFAWLFFGRSALPEPAPLAHPPFAPGMLRYVALPDIILSVPVPLATGTGAVSFDLTGARQALAGHVLYIQGAATDSTGLLHVTDALQLVAS